MLVSYSTTTVSASIFQVHWSVGLETSYYTLLMFAGALCSCTAHAVTLWMKILHFFVKIRCGVTSWSDPASATHDRFLHTESEEYEMIGVGL